MRSLSNGSIESDFHLALRRSFSSSRCWREGRKEGLSIFGISGGKKKKSAGILGSYALRFSSHASALVQRIDSRNKYEYCIYEEKGLFARAVQNLIGWSKMERDRHRTSETSRLIIRRVVQDHNWTNRAKEEMNEINRSIAKFLIHLRW